MNEKKPCEILLKIKQRIENGEPAENVIPYHINVPEEYRKEFIYYAVQVLPEGRKKDDFTKAWEKYYGS